jgi:hypothetical protein
MNGRRCLFATILLTLVFGVLVSGAVAQGAGTAPVVRNTAQPAEGAQVLKLKELWRVGGEEDENFFGAISKVIADEAGNVYLLDTQLAEVRVYSPQGEFLRTLGRQGEGPGEVRAPSDMFLTHDQRVALIQTFPGRVVMVDRMGTPAGGFLVGGSDPSQGRFGVLVQGAAGGGQVYLAGMHMTFSGQGPSTQTLFLTRCTLDGAELNTLVTKESTVNYADLVLAEADMDFVWNGRWAVDGQGRVFAAPERNAYRIQVFTPEGRVERTIEREYSSWKRTPDEVNVARLGMQALARNYPSPPRELTTLDTEPDIGGLYCAADGTLWVRTSRGDRNRAPGVFTVFDMIDGAGRFVRQVSLAGPGNPLEDALFLIGTDRAVVVTQALQAYLSMQGVTGEAGAQGEPMEIICYALER